MISHSFICKDGRIKSKMLSPIKAIREKCLECSAWSVKEARDCPAKDCALWPFRMGKAHKGK